VVDNFFATRRTHRPNGSFQSYPPAICALVGPIGTPQKLSTKLSTDLSTRLSTTKRSQGGPLGGAIGENLESYPPLFGPSIITILFNIYIYNNRGRRLIVDLLGSDFQFHKNLLDLSCYYTLFSAVNKGNRETFRRYKRASRRAWPR